MVKPVQKTEILLAFGGNLPSSVGLPDVTILRAVDQLRAHGFELVALSPFYRTPAVTLEAGDVAPEYVNAAARMRVALPPGELLTLTQGTEAAFGRTPAARWTARPLDIDLLAYGEAVLPDISRWRTVTDSEDPAAILSEPVVPHPRLHLRGFVLSLAEP